MFIKKRSQNPTDRAQGRPAGRRGERGAVMAEFALVLPLLVILVVGIAEFGIAFNRAQAVEAAAREGGRLASLSSTSSGQVTTRVNAALAGIPLTSGPAVTVSPSSCAGREGQSITVTVTATDAVNIPLLPTMTANLRGQAVFRCEA